MSRYTQERPSRDYLLKFVKQVDDVIAHSAAARKEWRRTGRRGFRDDGDRLEALRAVLAEMDAVGPELKRIRGLAIWHDFGGKVQPELERVAPALQQERKSLRRMI